MCPPEVVSQTLVLRTEIRPSDRSEIERITRTTGFFSPEEVAIALEVFDHALSESDSGYLYVVAELKDDIAGYAFWGLDSQTQCSYELYWIAVDTSFQASGVGTQLLAWVENYVAEQGHGQLFIETAGRPQYKPTRDFYEHQGYVQAAWLADYFAPGDARVIYSKRL